jgi:predicted transcriptional regulator
MQEAIAEYVDRQEKLDGLRQETVAALEEFQRTGMHLTAEEVDEWLTKIAAGQTVPLPKCHL